jgi:hypothetical protein
MTIIGGRKMRLFVPKITASGEWMVSDASTNEAVDTFCGTYDQINAVCDVWNKRERERYLTEGREHLLDSIRNDRRTLREIAASHDLRFDDDSSDKK